MPQITFFKVVYRRHTNFATEAIDQTFNGTVGFGKKVSCIVSRNGDLISQCYLEVTMAKVGTGPGGADGPASFFPGEAFVNTVQLEIGGQQVDQHSSDWIHMYGELFRTGEASTAYRRLVDFDGYEPTGYIKRFYIPLIFFFNRNGFAIQSRFMPASRSPRSRQRARIAGISLGPGYFSGSDNPRSRDNQQPSSSEKVQRAGRHGSFMKLSRCALFLHASGRDVRQRTRASRCPSSPLILGGQKHPAARARATRADPTVGLPIP